MESCKLTARVFVLLFGIFYTDAVQVTVSGYDPMANLMNITCKLNGNTYSNSKEVQWTLDGDYLTGCTPSSCMKPVEERYTFTPTAESITITIQPINFQKDGMKWTCTLDGSSDNVNLQFFPLPCSAKAPEKQTGGTIPMGGGMPFPTLDLVTIIIAVIILILVIALLIIVVRRRNESSRDPETAGSKQVTRKEGNGKTKDKIPLIEKNTDKARDDAAAKADAELIENSVREHRDKIKGVAEEMKKTQKNATDVFETAKEVEGLALVLLRLSKGEAVKEDDKGYARIVDPKEALKEELHGEIAKRGDRLKSIGAEYENDTTEVVLANKQGNFTDTQTLINEAKRHMCTTKQFEGELRDFCKGTKKVLNTVKETMNEVRPKLQRR